MSAPLLQVSHVTACYGVLPVLHDVSLDIHPREIVALIGANGAGKTTLMMSIFGRPRPSHGKILFERRNITELPAHAIARLGIAQSPEGRRIFPRMTVMENLQMGAIIANAEVFEQDLDRVCTLFPVLKARRDQRGGTLSGGEQQMLAIARALMGRPKLLLLDEPSLGLAPLIDKQIFEVIKELNSKHGLPVFIVEQNAYHALKLAHRGYVMVNGRITLSGSGAELLSSEEVQTAYLDGGRRKETHGARP
jgi:branched-chain amino acid transport system ATP-binding protein